MKEVSSQELHREGRTNNKKPKTEHVLLQEDFSVSMISKKKPKQIKIAPVGLNRVRAIVLDNSDQENDKNLQNNQLISYRTPAVKVKSRRALQARQIDSPEILDFDLPSMDSVDSADESIEERRSEGIALFSTPSFGRTKRIVTPPPPKERRPQND